MEEFYFYVDEKVTVWERAKCSIKAESKEDAIEKMKQLMKDGMIGSDNDVSVDYETLLDTQSVIDPKDNQGYSTRELILVENKVQTTVYQNGQSN